MRPSHVYGVAHFHNPAAGSIDTAIIGAMYAAVFNAAAPEWTPVLARTSRCYLPVLCAWAGSTRR